MDKYIRNKTIERYIDSFILHEMKENGFNRYDIIVRLLAVEEYYKKNNYGFLMYEQMQEIRFKQKPYIREALEKRGKLRFCELIDSIEKNGYNDNDNPILLNDCAHLINGAHRLALGFFYKIDFLTCRYSNLDQGYHDHIQYGLTWFEENFEQSQCLIIERRMKQLLDERGMLAYSIVWPVAYPYIDSIEKEISQYFEIISYLNLNFIDRETLISFIELVYSRDHYRAERASEKIVNLGPNMPMNIRIFQMKFSIVDTPIEEKICQGRDVRFIPIEYLQNAKGKIRELIKKDIKDYVFDNAFHCGQTISENIFLQELYENIK